MFHNEKYTEATILILDVKLHAHQLVLCIQSINFEQAFQNRLVKSSSGILSFHEGNGAAHWRIFGFLYIGDYSDQLSTQERGAVVLMFASKHAGPS